MMHSPIELIQMAQQFIYASAAADPRCLEVIQRMRARFPAMDEQRIRMGIELIAAGVIVR